MPAPVVRILGRLARQPTAPLHEHLVLGEAIRIAREVGASVRVDGWGNLILAPPGPRRGPAIWLVAHTDHPGFEVVGRGEARFLGGVAPPYFRRGTPLRFYHDGAAIPARLRRYNLKTGRLVFDGGRESRLLRRRDFGVWELEDFRVAGGLVHARQLDDLAGSAVSLAALARAVPNRRQNLRVLLTRAEEIGFVGSLGAAADGRIPPSAWVISLEASKALPGVGIGMGPVIRVGDRRRTFDPRAEALLHEGRGHLPKAKPVQRFLMSGGTCEATSWGVFGYRTTGVAIPLGNYHNQGDGNRVRAEHVAVKDLTTAVDLLELTALHAKRGEAGDDLLKAHLLGSLREYGGRLRASRPGGPKSL
jgi:putative aminopeptidase FrvX